MNLVITGTSAGIGRALAARLLQRGHRVWGLARSSQDDFAAGQGGNFRTSRCDVADWAAVRAVAAEIGAALAVASTAWSRLRRLSGRDRPGRDGRSAALDRNGAEQSRWGLLSHPRRAFHSRLQSGRRPKIVCFSGGGSTKPRPNFSAYGAAKTAIVRLVETIAAEEAGKLDINAIAPGAVTTRMTEEIRRPRPGGGGSGGGRGGALNRRPEGAATPERASSPWSSGCSPPPATESPAGSDQRSSGIPWGDAGRPGRTELAAERSSTPCRAGARQLERASIDARFRLRNAVAFLYGSLRDRSQRGRNTR